MRADKFLSANGYYESRARARVAIEAGLVLADGNLVKKPSEILSEDMQIEAGMPYPWVSRAGLKLVHALQVFGVDPKNRVCLDVGASTGGFTHVLKDQGAVRIYAVDVGHGQLHDSLRADAQIISMEHMDARNLTREHMVPPPDLVVCDVSFISCMKALEVPLRLAVRPADLITLVKPQFEVGRAGVGKNGIVRDEKLALAALQRVKDWVPDQGWQVVGEDISPIKGGGGNTEYLLHARIEP
ncbi:MAG: TlyA family rRNA (cytidine-2'-O)-methyltransferase [Robiginitomaculum sp.]|nr:MAG: TlyA family rRNA (cytidine-2'-O)-methyltransferase [Robiginitomaculum sp.]